MTQGPAMGGAGTGVSIALATYNGAALIAEQLDSIVAQTLPPCEIVVSDDGSTDDTIAVIAAYARTSPVPVRILPPGPRLGFADNFLRAAAHCVHRFIAFSDQDDVWLPDKVATMVARLTGDRSVLALHRSILTRADLTPYGMLDQGITADRVLAPLEIDPYMTGWGNTMMFDRRLLGLIPAAARPGHPETTGRLLSHDTWIYTLALVAGRVSHIAEPLCLYRQHGSNVNGAPVPGLARRARAAVTVPLHRFRARIGFDDAMVRLLSDATPRDPLLYERMRQGAAAYAARRERLALRVCVYRADTSASRAMAFARLARADLRLADARGNATSLAKDALLGIFGIGRIDDRAAPASVPASASQRPSGRYGIEMREGEVAA